MLKVHAPWSMRELDCRELRMSGYSCCQMGHMFTWGGGMWPPRGAHVDVTKSQCVASAMYCALPGK
jgi:hypothetical protein